MNLDHNKSWFAFTPIISNIVIIAVTLAIYYVFVISELFPDWANVIYWVVKIIIAFQIIIASARSLIAPALSLLAGWSLMFMLQVYNLSFVSTADAWQLIIVSGIGFVITILVRLI
jgi:hypothetical protein